MRACDRHAKNDGSLKKFRYESGIFDYEDLDELGRPKKVLDWDFCTSCFEDVMDFLKESEPDSLYMVEPAEPVVEEVEQPVEAEEGANA